MTEHVDMTEMPPPTDTAATRPAEGNASAAAQRPTAALGEALGEVIREVRGKDLALAVAAFAASYWLLRPRGGEAAQARAAALAADMVASPRRRNREPAADAFSYPLDPELAWRAEEGLAPEARGLRGLGLAWLGSAAARQGVRWLWQGTRAVRSDAVARLAGHRPGALGRASHLFARASAWREKHALAQARRELDDDLRALRRAARRR